MNRIVISGGLCLALVFGMIASSATSLAQGPVKARPAGADPAATAAEARERYKRGLQLSKEENYEAALVEMQRAYELSPTYKILYNLGLIHVHLGDYAAGLDAYKRYLAEGGKAIPMARQVEVQKEIDRLRGRVAEAEIHVNVPDAEVMVDDETVGKSPLSAPVIVNSGKRKFSASKKGLVSASRVVQVAGNDHLTLDLELIDPKAPPRAGADLVGAGAAQQADKDREARARDTSHTRKTWLMVGWSATGVLAVGATITGIVALSASSNLGDARDAPGMTRADLDAKESRTRNFALATDLLAGASIVVGGISLYYTLDKGASRDARKEKPASVNLGITATSLGLVGSF